MREFRDLPRERLHVRLRIFEQCACDLDHHSHMQPRRFGISMHPVHILHRLSRRAFAQVIQALHHHQPFARGIERETDIAKIRVRHMLQFRQRPAGRTAPSAARIKLPIQRFDFLAARGASSQT